MVTTKTETFEITASESTLEKLHDFFKILDGQTKGVIDGPVAIDFNPSYGDFFEAMSPQIQDHSYEKVIPQLEQGDGLLVMYGGYVMTMNLGPVSMEEDYAIAFGDTLVGYAEYVSK